MPEREQTVVIWKAGDATYPQNPPFHPDRNFPETINFITGRERNIVYGGIRETFRLAGLDIDNYGKKSWNPLKCFIKKGDVVLLKPNLVKEHHPRDPNGWRYVLTHGSVIRAVADYVFKALDGSGEIVVGDAPQTDSSFRKIANISGLEIIAEYYRKLGLPFSLVDFRKEEWINRRGVIVDRISLPGDPNGYVSFDLSGCSEFCDHGGAGRYYGADYDSNVVNDHHDGLKNEYLVSATAIKCDVFFNLPKLKTHKKAGVTISLKNLVGVNGDKNWLPHYTEGEPSTCGDQFPEYSLTHRSENRAVKFLKRAAVALPGVGPRLMQAAKPIGDIFFGNTENTIRSGNWYGNDTVWRMCLDLNKLVMYGNPDGTLRPNDPSQRKRYLSLVDGIIGGEGNGPMNPDPCPSGVLIFGANPVTVDAVGATVMGFDLDKIPTVAHGFRVDKNKLTTCSAEDIKCLSNYSKWNASLLDIDPETLCRFKPHFGWENHIELRNGNAGF